MTKAATHALVVGAGTAVLSGIITWLTPKIPVLLAGDIPHVLLGLLAAAGSFAAGWAIRNYGGTP